jgi:hypothetical protein
MSDDAKFISNPEGPISGYIRVMMHSILAQAKARGAQMPDGMSMAGIDIRDLEIIKMMPDDLSRVDQRQAFITACAGWAVLYSLSQQTLHELAGTKGVKLLDRELARYCGITEG